MKNPRLWAAAAAILVLGGGSAAFIAWRDADQRASTRARLLRVAEAELEASDPESRLDALRAIEAALADHDDDELQIMQARLLLAMHRYQLAWDALEVLATTPGGPIEARRVGAQVQAARYSRSGDLQQGSQARGLALQHAESADDPASAFVALQMSFRMGDVEAFLADRSRLLQMAEDAVERDTVVAISPYLVALLGDRSGLDLKSESLATVAGGSGARAALANLAIELNAAEQEEDREALLALANDWQQLPDELELLIAMAEIRSNDSNALADAWLRLSGLLERWPTSVDARHAMVVVLYGRGERAGKACQGHLSWLLTHAPDEDLRRSIWQQLVLR